MPLTVEEYAEMCAIGRDLDEGVGSMDTDIWIAATQRYNELQDKMAAPEQPADGR